MRPITIRAMPAVQLLLQSLTANKRLYNTVIQLTYDTVFVTDETISLAATFSRISCNGRFLFKKKFFFINFGFGQASILTFFEHTIWFSNYVVHGQCFT